MKVWMIHAQAKEMTKDSELIGPFSSAEFVMNDSVWNYLTWTPDPVLNQYKAEFSCWHLCLYEVVVQG